MWRFATIRCPPVPAAVVTVQLCEHNCPSVCAVRRMKCWGGVEESGAFQQSPRAARELQREFGNVLSGREVPELEQQAARAVSSNNGLSRADL